MRPSILLLALLSVANAADDPPIRTTVTPLIAQAPAQIHLKIIIERHPDNRRVDFAIEGADYGTGGSREVDGEAGARVYDIWWKGVPCGTYAVGAAVRRSDGTSKVARSQPVRVLGIECPSSEVEP